MLDFFLLKFISSENGLDESSDEETDDDSVEEVRELILFLNTQQFSNDRKSKVSFINGFGEA